MSAIFFVIFMKTMEESFPNITLSKLSNFLGAWRRETAENIEKKTAKSILDNTYYNKNVTLVLFSNALKPPVSPCAAGRLGRPHPCTCRRSACGLSWLCQSLQPSQFPGQQTRWPQKKKKRTREKKIKHGPIKTFLNRIPQPYSNIYGVNFNWNLRTF